MGTLIRKTIVSILLVLRVILHTALAEESILRQPKDTPAGIAEKTVATEDGFVISCQQGNNSGFWWFSISEDGSVVLQQEEVLQICSAEGITDLPAPGERRIIPRLIGRYLVYSSSELLLVHDMQEDRRALASACLQDIKGLLSVEQDGMLCVFTESGFISFEVKDGKPWLSYFRYEGDHSSKFLLLPETHQFCFLNNDNELIVADTREKLGTLPMEAGYGEYSLPAFEPASRVLPAISWDGKPHPYWSYQLLALDGRLLMVDSEGQYAICNMDFSKDGFRQLGAGSLECDSYFGYLDSHEVSRSISGTLLLHDLLLSIRHGTGTDGEQLDCSLIELPFDSIRHVWSWDERFVILSNKGSVLVMDAPDFLPRQLNMDRLDYVRISDSHDPVDFNNGYLAFVHENELRVVDLRCYIPSQQDTSR